MPVQYESDVREGSKREAEPHAYLRVQLFASDQRPCYELRYLTYLFHLAASALPALGYVNQFLIGSKGE